MGAKYSYGVWEQFADQASTILGKQKFDFLFWVSKLWQAYIACRIIVVL